MMHELDKHLKAFETFLKRWAEKAKVEYPGQLESSVRHAVDRMDPAGLARAYEEVVATVTGNRKTAKRARKSVEALLHKAQRKAGSKHAGRGPALMVLCTVAVIGLLVVIVLRRAAGPHARDLGAGTPRSPEEHTPADPDLGT